MREKLEIWCNENNIIIRELTPYQLRLTKDKIVCDIYPVNKRYHIINHVEPEMIQQRGGIETLNEFLEAVFNY